MRDSSNKILSGISVTGIDFPGGGGGGVVVQCEMARWT
jgi:hypothetical protein